MSDGVFVDCPFDDDYRDCFQALIFTIVASGYQVRCALEDSSSGDIRFEKLCRLIGACDRSVHDLSRVELGASGPPRFNMPFELGLLMGAKRFGGKRQKSKSALVMIREPFRLPVYLSDLAGSDPLEHHGRPEEVVRVVRRYLHMRPDGDPLPAPARFIEEFRRFKTELPEVAKTLQVSTEDLDPYREYRPYLECVKLYIMLS